MIRLVAIVLTLFSLQATRAASLAENPAVQAIYDDNLPQLEQYLKNGGDANATSGRNNTLLMYAGAYGTPEAMKLLLAHGANPNLTNAFGATALMWSISDLAKVKLLLLKGADPNIESKSKRTALLLAALHGDGGKTVTLLAAHGANPATVDEFGLTLVSAGASAGNLTAVRLGLAHHVDVNAKTKIGGTALTGAAMNGSVEIAKLLLDAGADVNVVTGPARAKVKNGTVTNARFTPLILAAPYGPPALVKLLLDRGAKLDPVDERGMTALQSAVASESDNVKTVRLLLAKGADVSFRNKQGESAQDWARRYARPAVMSLVGLPAVTSAQLPAIPASDSITLPPAEGYSRTMSLLEKTSGNFVREGGCVACHAQNITAVAAAAGRANGLTHNAEAAQERLRTTRLNWASQLEGLLLREDGPGGAANVVASLLGMAADGYKPDLLTAAMLRSCALQQGADGAWRRLLSIARVPSEDSVIGLTAEVVHAMALYTNKGNRAEYARRVDHARRFLLTAKPTYTTDENSRLLGLKWAGASTVEIAKAARTVAASQRASGGWGQNPNLPEDAYATGQALVALQETGMPVTDPIFLKGTAFLLRTQAPDGSWHVTSRAVKIQPYFQSGFPYDHDQWISMSATAWAAMALAEAAGADRKPVHLAASLR